MRKQILIILLLIVSFFTNVYAATEEDLAKATQNSVLNNINADDAWHFMVAPYAWITWDNGHITVLNKKSKIDSTPSDIKNALDSALQLHLEANKNRATFMLDPTYIELSDSYVKYKQVLVDFGGFYRFKSYVAPQSDAKLDVEGFFGGRYWYFKNEISLPNWSFSRDKKWLDPVVGGRLIYNIKNKWIFSLNGNIGGFGLISKFTWQIKAIGRYNFNRYFGIGAGFQALYIDYKDGKNLTEFRLRKTTYGPMIGLVVTF